MTYEKAYVFSPADAWEFLKQHNLEVESNGYVYTIHDYYLSRDLRLRNTHAVHNLYPGRLVPDEYILTRKQGNKSDGHRREKAESVSADASLLLIPDSKLYINKSRFKLKHSDPNYIVTIDIVDRPMRVAILEVESTSSSPIPDRFFGCDLVECPLSAWEYFRRKITFCGAPSSGKTEMAKWLSHVINTEFSGNAYHVVEYATNFIQKYGKNPEFKDQLLVWWGQHNNERNAERTSNFVVSDCPTFLSYIYAVRLHRGPINLQDSLQLSKMYEQSLFDAATYNNTFFLPLQLYKSNGIRYQNADEAVEIGRRIEDFLKQHDIPYVDTTYNDDSKQKIIDSLLYLNPI